jgi:outer membrane protein TolC
VAIVDNTERKRAEEMFLEMQQREHNGEENRRPAPPAAGAYQKPLRGRSCSEQIGIAQAAYYPTLNLSALAGFQGSLAANWFNWPSRLWAVGPSFSETLFDAGGRRATKVSAVAAYDANVASYRQTTLTAFQQVEDNLAVLRILAGESQQQHNATAAAEESLHSFQNRYAGGVDT